MLISQRPALALSGGLGQDAAPVPVFQPVTTYQEAFDAAFKTCTDMLGHDECRRMLGYIPFLCPPPAQRPMYTHPIFWLFGGLLIAKVFF